MRATTGASSFAIQRGIDAHRAWKAYLLLAIDNNPDDLPLDRIGADCYCTLGAWLHGVDLSDVDKSSVFYQIVVQWHRLFHEVAAQVAREVLARKKETARELLDGAYADVSQSLISALMAWKTAEDKAAAAANDRLETCSAAVRSRAYGDDHWLPRGLLP